MKTLQDKLQKLPPTRRKKIDDRAEQLVAQEMTLRDLRKALKLTQVNLSKKLHINQEGISRIEHRSDLLLSTLISYIEAMGGQLKLTVEFPNRPPITLEKFGGIDSRPSA